MSSFKKKFVLLSLATVLSVASILPAYGAEERGSAYLKSVGIIQGADNTGDLKLNDTINRAELMKIIAKAATVKELSSEDYSNCLPDIHDQWFASFVCWAYDKGYVAGYPDGVFRAGNPVTHAEALKIITETLRSDYSRFEPIAKPDLWYDIYVKNALSRNIVGKDIENKLAEPASRREVFDYLYRMMAIGSTGIYAFSDEMYTTFPETKIYESRAPRTLSESEEELLQVINATVEQGIRPMTSSGSAMVSFKMEDKEQGTMESRVDVMTQQSITGEKDRLDALALDLLTTVDFKLNTPDLPVKVRGKVGVNLAMSGATMLYAKVNTLEVVELDAPVAAKIGINQAVEMLRPYVGIWYAVDMASLPEDFTLTEVANPYKQIDTVLRTLLSKTRSPFVQVTKGMDGGKSTLIVTFDPKAAMDFAEVLGAEVEPGFNVYDIRSTMGQSLPFIQKLAEHASFIIAYDSSNYFVSTTRMLLEKLSHAFPDGPIVELEAYSKEDTQYPDALTIELPKESTPFEDLLDSMFGSTEEETQE